MAIPSALAQKRKQLEAVETKSQPTDVSTVDVATPPVSAVASAPTLTVAPTIAPTPQSDNPVSQLTALEARLNDAVTPEALAEVKREIADMTAKYSTMSGRVSAESKRAAEAEARFQQLDIAARQFQDRATEAERQRDELHASARERERNAQLQGLDDSSEMSDEEINNVSPDDAKMIRSLTKKQFVPLLKTLYAEVDELKTKLKSVEDVGARVSQISKSQEESEKQARAVATRAYFKKELTPHAPNWEQAVGTEEWKEFMKLPADPTRPDFKRGHMVAHLQKTKDVMGLAAFIKDFESKQAASGSAIAQYVTPAATTAAAAVPTKVIMKSSEYAAKQHEFTRAKTLDKAGWEAYKTRFFAAMKDGRVEDDAKII